MKEIILFNNNYLLINIESNYENNYIMQSILIYLLIYDNESNFKFEYLNTFSDSEYRDYKGIFKINNIISLITDNNNILFTRLNNQKNNLEEFSNLEINNNNHCIEISNLKNEIIIIKYSYSQYNTYFKLKIYNIKLKQIISTFKFNVSEDILVLDNKYLMTIKEKIITLYNLKTFKKICTEEFPFSYIIKCNAFKAEDGNWNVICGRNWSIIKNGKIDFFRWIYGDEFTSNEYSSNIVSSSEEYEDF